MKLHEALYHNTDSAINTTNVNRKCSKTQYDGSNNPLHVAVYVEGNYICVKNNITEIPKNKTSFHIGLKNINTRYLLLAQKGISITNGTIFLVKIPIIR